MNAAAPEGTPPRRINNREHFLKNTELPRLMAPLEAWQGKNGFTGILRTFLFFT